MYVLAQTLRVRTVRPLVRFEGLPGEFSQHDFGEAWVTFQDGREEKVHFFASRLKYSRWVEVRLIADERVETLVRALVEHLAAFGGIPFPGAPPLSRPIGSASSIARSTAATRLW